MTRAKKPAQPAPRLGRPVTGTADGRARFQFDVPEAVAVLIRAKHDEASCESGIAITAYLARTVCRALGISPLLLKKSARKS